MSTTPTTFVSILDKEYQVACPEEEKAALTRASIELDKRMRVIRSTGTITGTERIAIMAALNLCHELQQAHTGGKIADPEVLERMAKKLNSVLSFT